MRRAKGRIERPETPAESTEFARQAAGIIDAALQQAEGLWPELWRDLTETGRLMFANELLEASMSTDPDRLSAIGQVIEAWQRTWRLRQDPGYRKAMKRTGRSPEQLEERTYTITELKDRFSNS